MYKYDSHRCAFQTTKLAPMEQFSKIYLLQSEAALFDVRLRIKVANHRFSTREKIVMCCDTSQHNLREILPRSSQKSFLVLFFKKEHILLFVTLFLGLFVDLYILGRFGCFCLLGFFDVVFCVIAIGCEHFLLELCYDRFYFGFVSLGERS